jgi:AraC-like DNA-binding protein
MFAHMPIIRDIIYGAVHRGAQLAELCQLLQISTDDLSDSEIKVDFTRASNAWEHSVRLTKDNLLGLHVGETTTTSVLGMVGNLMQSSADLLSAFEKVTQYSTLASDMFHYRIKSATDEVALIYEPEAIWVKTAPQCARHATEQAMAGTLQVFYLLAGKKLKPSRTYFRHKRGGDLGEYQRIFDSPVQFSSSENQLVFPKTTLLTRVISHDRSLSAVFENMLREKKFKKNELVHEQIRRVLLTDFQGQIPSLEIIAAQLHMTPRTVQRRLSDEGISFRALVADIQKELASRFMNMKGSNVSQVAGFLGYSDPSAFRRAYKKWND